MTRWSSVNGMFSCAGPVEKTVGEGRRLRFEGVVFEGQAGLGTRKLGAMLIAG